jgi:hypothetical protein
MDGGCRFRALPFVPLSPPPPPPLPQPPDRILSRGGGECRDVI